MTETPDEIEITPEMIEVGFRVLLASGLAGDDLLEADRLTVVEIYRAMASQEIDRLRKALERTRPHVRNEIIEECARVAETFAPSVNSVTCKGIADAIRALKEKA